MNRKKVGVIARNFPSRDAAKLFQDQLKRQFFTVTLLMKPRFFGFGRYQWAVADKK